MGRESDCANEPVLDSGLGSSLDGDEFLDLLPLDVLLAGPAEVLSTDEVDMRDRLDGMSEASLPIAVGATAAVHGFTSLKKLSSLVEGLDLGCTGACAGKHVSSEKNSFGLRSGRSVRGGVPGGENFGETVGDSRGLMPFFLAILSWNALAK
jgi:hypothetical protein